jgi:hypothetical protein
MFFDYDARIAWNVPSHVARDGTRVDVETTPRGKADDESDRFVRKEVIGRRDPHTRHED